MILVGLDPSYTRTGISIVDTEQKTIKFFKYGSTIGEQRFLQVFNAAEDRVSSILDFINSSVGKVDCLITETPPPNGVYSSGLYGLDFLLVHEVKRVLAPDELYGVTPSYLGHVHKTRKYSKTDSVNLAKSILQDLRSFGYRAEESRLAHDECEAFLFVCRLIVRKNLPEASLVIAKAASFKDAKEFAM